MATKTIRVAFQNSTYWDTRGLNADNWNSTGGYDPQIVGEVIADLIDAAGGASTGISLSVTAACEAKYSIGGTNQIHHGWAWGVWDQSWSFERDAFDGEITLPGFSPGQTGTIKLAAHNGNASNATVFVLNGVTTETYTPSDPPAAPLEVPFTADSGGNLVISTNKAGGLTAGINGLELTYDEPASQTITNIDQLISGQTANVTLSASMNVTGVTVSDGTTTISGITPTGSGTSWSFTSPAITDLATGLKLGNVSVTLTDGTDTTAGYSIAYQLSGYTAANITSVSDFALGVYFDPPTQVGDQFAYQADKGKVETNGEWNDGGIDPPFVGTQTLWHYSSVDQTWRDFELTTTGDGSEPEPEPPSDPIGLTRRSITRRALTRRTMTSRGMTS